MLLNLNFVEVRKRIGEVAKRRPRRYFQHKMARHEKRFDPRSACTTSVRTHPLGFQRGAWCSPIRVSSLLRSVVVSLVAAIVLTACGRQANEGKMAANGTN